MTINEFVFRFIRTDTGQLCRLCQAIRWMLLTFLCVQVGFFVLAWMIPMPLHIGPLVMQLGPEGLSSDAVRQLSMPQKLLGIVLGLPGLMLLTYGVRRLGQTLQQFQQGAIFAASTIGHLRSFAGATFCSAIVFNLEVPLRAAVLNLMAGSEHYRVAIAVSSNELLLILVCSLFYLIAGVMHEGRRLEEENEGFI